MDYYDPYFLTSDYYLPRQMQHGTIPQQGEGGREGPPHGYPPPPSPHENPPHGERHGVPQSAPPSQEALVLYAIDPGAIRHCLYRYTYIWLKSGRSFWFYPTYVGPASIAGYQHSLNRDIAKFHFPISYARSD